MEKNSSGSSDACKSVPPLLSYFIDTFVDFSVAGFFLPPSSYQSPSSTCPPPPTRYPSPARLVAIGDLHGDLPKTLETLSLSSLLHPSTLSWAAGPTVAIQIGDVLDRGGNELSLLYLLHRLKSQAVKSNGHLITLHGNHEIMNADSDFRYVTPESLLEFSNWSFWFLKGLSMKSLSNLPRPDNPFAAIPTSFPNVKPIYWHGFRSRIAALRPGGPIATRFLADNQTIVVVGDSVFVHGGLTEDHVTYGLEKINEEVRDWINGKNGVSKSPGFMRGRDSVVWLRRFSEGRNCDCEDLGRVLGMMSGTKRMVMGHTIQTEGINGVCEDRAIRIDVGLSRGCGNGLPEVLEINEGKQVRILTANPAYDKRRFEKRDGAKEGLGILVPEGNLKEVETRA